MLTGNVDRIVGGTLVDIIVSETDEVDENYLGASGFDDVDYNRIITLKFDDGSEYMIYWRNASNGFYRGYLILSYRERH